jgi:CrcB protein
VSVDPEPGPLASRLVGLVAVGGALGTGARYGIEQWLPAGSGFPWGTLLANLLGALVLGVLIEMLTRRGSDTGRRRQMRLLVGTGFCGGLTTYSTLAVETDLLIRSHRTGLAVGYALVSVVAGIVVAAIGIAVATRMDRPA